MPGGGQVVVQGDYAYVGHMEPPHGTSIVDISDPTRPRLVTHIELPDPYSHTHKVRVVGDVDGRGLIYLVDPLNGLDVLEFTG